MELCRQDSYLEATSKAGHGIRVKQARFGKLAFSQQNGACFGQKICDFRPFRTTFSVKKLVHFGQGFFAFCVQELGFGACSNRDSKHLCCRVKIVDLSAKHGKVKTGMRTSQHKTSIHDLDKQSAASRQRKNVLTWFARHQRSDSHGSSCSPHGLALRLGAILVHMRRKRT